MPSESVYFDDPAFIASIRQNPDDDTVRLAYADWLEEHGQGERAEFIRAQISYGGGMMFLDNLPHLTSQRGRGKFLHRWRGSSGQWPKGSIQAMKQTVPDPESGHRCDLFFSRGFVKEATVPSAWWIRLGDVMLAKHPVRKVVWTDRPSVLRGPVAVGPNPFRLPGDYRWFEWHEVKKYFCGNGLDNAQHAVARLRWPGVEFEIREATSH
jgi:uncharacterized protein (TIGR02996 family)